LALCKDLAYYRSNDQSASEWWAQRRVQASLLLPEEETDKVLHPDAKLVDVLQAIDKVAESSTVGKKLVGKAQLDGWSDRLSTVVEDTLAKLKCDITVETLEANRKEFVLAVKKAGSMASETFRPRDRPFDYLGTQITSPVTSLLDHYITSVECLLRTRAIENELIKPLFCELDLAEPGRTKVVGTIDPSLLTKIRAARSAAEEFMAGVDTTSSNLQAMFKKRGAFLMNIDKYIKLEMKFFSSSSGDLGLKRVQGLILRLLPSASNIMEPAQSLARFEKMEGCALLDFAGMGAKSIFATVMSLVKSVAEGSMPNFQGATMTEFFKAVKLALSFFASMDVPASVGRLARTARGEDAVNYQLGQVKAKVTEKKEVLLGDLRLLIIFGWVLTKASQDLVKVWKAQAVASGVATFGRSAEASSSSSGPPKGKAGSAKCRTGKSKELDSMTRALFGR
jgi:hypothetical protein